MQLIISFYIGMVLGLHVVPIDALGIMKLNTMTFLSLRVDYLLHSLVFTPWMSLPYLPLKLQPSIVLNLGKTDVGSRALFMWFIIGISLAVGVEGVQYFLPHRSLNIMDVLFNIIGIFFGGILLFGGR